MRASCGPGWTRGPAFRYLAGRPDPGLRLSDADRSAAADRLSRHYGDGRLDQAEFNERLDQVMAARTHGDLDGIFGDLPAPEPAGAPPRPGRHAPGWHRILLLVLIIAVAASIGHVMAHLFVPWLAVALLVFLWLWYGRRHYRGG